MGIEPGERFLPFVAGVRTAVPAGGGDGRREEGAGGEQPWARMPTFANIAHRGASGHAPEATRPAFERAIAMDADYLELDIQMSRDRRLVAIHDTELERTTDGAGTVGTHTLAELQALDAGSWFNERHPERADPAFAGARLLTLDEILDTFGAGYRYYIETKSPERYPGVERALVATVERHGLVERGHVILQSFSEPSLRRLHQLNRGIPLVHLLWFATASQARAAVERLAGIAEYAVGIGVNAMEAGEGVVTRGLVAAAHDAGLRVHVYTVDDRSCMQRLIDRGVDGLFTNFPDRLAAVVRGRGG